MIKFKISNDVVLLLAIAGSVASGVLIPSVGLALEPYLLVWLGALLFLNLLRLKPSDLVLTFTRPRQLAILSAIKLLVLPLAIYAAVYIVYRPFALPCLLLSGISTGLGAPFVANLVGGRLPLIVGMIIVTSLAVPFVMPAIVYELLGGSEFKIPLGQMIFLLSAALFTPLAAGWLTKRYSPSVSRFADEKSFPLSIVFVILINFGMFAKFSEYFYSETQFLLQTVAAAFLLFAAFGLVGYAATFGDRQEKMAGLVSMMYVNNVLVAVFALQFFGSQVAALAALYNIPYYAGIIPIKKIILRLNVTK